MGRPQWTYVDPTTLTESVKKKVDGVEVTLLVSPYDIPDAFRGYYDHNKKRFIVEFHYLGDEQRKEVAQSEHVTLQLGRNTGRIYGLLIDVDKAGAQWVMLTLAAIEERRRQQHRIPRRAMNSAVASRLFKEKAPELQAVAG